MIRCAEREIGHLHMLTSSYNFFTTFNMHQCASERN